MQSETQAAAGKKRPLVLVVDDAEEQRKLLSLMLKPRYDTRLAVDGAQALQSVLLDPLPELVLLDVNMPGMDGYEVCKRLKSNPATADIPVMFVTAQSDPKEEMRALLLGAADFLTKPISPPSALLRVAHQVAVRDAKRQLELLVGARTKELARSRLQIVRRLARAMEYRNGGLTHRVARVCQYVKLLAAGYGLTPAECEALSEAATPYDIGKLGVPEVILQKTDTLTEREWEEVRAHPQIGAEIIGEHQDPLLAAARIMALTHHERWDGTGYPAKLAGEAIPLPGRIIAVADAFEAMTSTQRHRAPRTVEEAGNIIVQEAGKQFDPRVVAAFRKVIRKFVDVRRVIPDELAGIHDLDFAVPEKKSA